jgi:hypothetical protein
MISGKELMYTLRDLAFSMGIITNILKVKYTFGQNDVQRRK